MRSWSLELRDPVFALFVAATLVSLVRAKDQPSIDVSAGGTVVSVTPADVLLAALLFAVGVLLVRGARISAGAWPVLLTALAFGGWVVLSSLGNGATAMVAAGKARRARRADARGRARARPGCAAASPPRDARRVDGRGSGVRDRRIRTGAGPAPVVVPRRARPRDALDDRARRMADHARDREEPSWSPPARRRRHRRVGITLGASFASLLGLYLVAGAVLLVGSARGSLPRRALLLTLLVAARSPPRR